MHIHTIAETYRDYSIQMRRYFHQHPEVSGQEYETCRAIRAELDQMGIAWKPCGLETGTLAEIQGDRPGKTILIRADMDALTVQEETGAAYASVNPGVMHACGHDCHISMLLTAAQILKAMKPQLCGTVKLAFQPAEEIGAGAKSMIEQGALDGVDGCFAIHVWTDVPTGHVACKAGPVMASADQFIIKIKGKGGHGAAPHQCVDAVVAASQVVNQLQMIASREASPLDPVVVTVGTIQGGTRWNVVAEHAQLEGTMRCFSEALWDYLPGRLEALVESTAVACRAEAETEIRRLIPPTVNDDDMAKRVRLAAQTVIAEGAPVDLDAVMAAEDFSFFMREVPGAIAFLGTGSEDCGAVYANHNGKFCVDETMLIKGAMLYAQVAMDFNQQNEKGHI